MVPAVTGRAVVTCCFCVEVPGFLALYHPPHRPYPRELVSWCRGQGAMLLALRSEVFYRG